MWTSAFRRDVVERAFRTAAQAALSTWLVGDVALNAFTIDWRLLLGMAAGGALSSLLTSVASPPRGQLPPVVEEPSTGRHAA